MAVCRGEGGHMGHLGKMKQGCSGGSQGPERSLFLSDPLLMFVLMATIEIMVPPPFLFPHLPSLPRLPPPPPLSSPPPPTFPSLSLPPSSSPSLPLPSLPPVPRPSLPLPPASSLPFYSLPPSLLSPFFSRKRPSTCTSEYNLGPYPSALNINTMCIFLLAFTINSHLARECTLQSSLSKICWDSYRID